MSPELEALLKAMYERDTCEPEDLARWVGEVNRLIDDAMSRRPGLSRDGFFHAIAPRYVEFRRKQRKTPSLPPSA